LPGLSSLNVDPEAAAAAYRERVIGPHRGVLPDSAVARVEEQLSGACTVEIASLRHRVHLTTTRATSRGSVRAASRSSKVCPVGAVSTTTNESWAEATVSRC